MKRIVMGCAAASFAILFAGCQMCTKPIQGDPSCVEPSHLAGNVIDPNVVDYSKPIIVPTKDVFRPVFKAGTERVSAIGAGNSLEDATADAVAKILTNNKCDYLVAVTRIITKKTHPAGFFRFATTNYTVTISGIPITLDKLTKEEVKVSEKPKDPKAASSKDSAEIEKIVKVYFDKLTVQLKEANQKPPVAPAPVALVNLTDINLSMTAKANSREPVAIGVPAPRPGQGVVPPPPAK